MRAIDDLRREHRVIELVLTGLESLAEQAEKEHRVDRQRAERALEILRNFADRCHHNKEERNLFQLMEGRGVPRQGGPLEVMLHEHELGRGHIASMTQALLPASEGDSKPVAAFAVHARAYAELLRQHIAKEDRVLYPMAERLLTQEDDERLVDAFEAVERDEMGEGVHEKYHQWAHELADDGH